MAAQVPAAASRASADFQAWSDTAELFLDTSPGGINFGAEVRNFPLLVRLRAPDFTFPRARGQGQDLRFSNAYGTPLPHEIESWDSAGGRADVWVMMDTVHANSATQSLRMYWGNPAAADSSNPGAVFAASRGMRSVWHLGGAGAEPRPNAVAGGPPATPMAYEGDENRPGVIGRCDSLDGGAPGDYLDAGDGHADWSAGFTYSAWVMPTAVKTWGRLMDFGNGTASNNIILGRDAGTDNLAVHMYPGVGNTHSRLNTPAFFTLNQWQHVAVTVTPADSAVRAYRNGALIWTGKLLAPIANIARTESWLGRSHWAADQYWQGKFDEVRLEAAARGGDWIRLNYESQRAGSAWVTFRARQGCQPRFAAPPDTSVAEGEALDLAATADCAAAFDWSPAGGLPVRIVDPSVKTLTFSAPRVSGDTQVTFRFQAVLAGAPQSALVQVRIREAIPEPLFTLPDTLAWNSRDSLSLAPAFTNLAAVKASRDSILSWHWTLAGNPADTVWRGDSLILARPAVGGTTVVELCVDNRGPPTCRSTRLEAGSVGVPSRPRGPARPPATSGNGKGLRRLDGRLVKPRTERPLQP